MASSKIFYDRVEISINGVPYLPNGEIRSFNIDMGRNSKLVDGMTSDGRHPGVVIGNSGITFDWVELLTSENSFINLDALLTTTPDSTFEITPFTWVSGAAVQTAPNFVISGIILNHQGIPASNQGTEIVRRCSFSAIACSNLNI